MKFIPLVWAGLWRSPTRTIFTGLSIVIAFLLLGLLDGVNAGFAKAIADAHREFLITNTRVRGGAPMPLASMAKIQSIPGVEEVAQRAYFTGNARGADPRNYIAAIATVPDIFFRVTAGLIVSKESLSAMRANRAGMLVTQPLLEQFGWRIGDTIPLQSATVKTDGSRTWTFQIVGTINTPESPSKAYFGVINYAYFNEYRVENRDTAEIFYERIADPTKAIATAAAIDRIFANSPNETRTRSAQERAESQAKQMGDVSFFTNAIMGAVIFTLAFLTGNTLRQSLQERTPEFAILKALGYGDETILALAFAEALLLCVPSAVLGLSLAYVVGPLAQEVVGAVYVSSAVAISGVVCAGLLALIGSALPAFRLARMPIVASLGKR